MSCTSPTRRDTSLTVRRYWRHDRSRDHATTTRGGEMTTESPGEVAARGTAAAARADGRAEDRMGRAGIATHPRTRLRRPRFENVNGSLLGGRGGNADGPPRRMSRRRKPMTKPCWRRRDAPATPTIGHGRRGRVPIRRDMTTPRPTPGWSRAAAPLKGRVAPRPATRKRRPRPAGAEKRPAHHELGRASLNEGQQHARHTPTIPHGSPAGTTRTTGTICLIVNI